MSRISAVSKSFRPVVVSLFLVLSVASTVSHAGGLDAFSQGLGAINGVLGGLAHGVPPAAAQGGVASVQPGVSGTQGVVGRQSSAQGVTPTSTVVCLEGICIGDPLSKHTALPWLYDKTKPSYEFPSKDILAYPVVAHTRGDKTERGSLALQQLNGESIAALYGVQSWCEKLPVLTGHVKTTDGSTLRVGAKSVKLATGQVVYYVDNLREDWPGLFSEVQFAQFREQAAGKFRGAAYVTGELNPAITDPSTMPFVYISKQRGLVIELLAPTIWLSSNQPGDLRGSPGCADQMNIQIR